MLTATMKSTTNGIYCKDPDTEEPDERKSLKSGSGVAAGWVTAPPTITKPAFNLKDNVASPSEKHLGRLH
jgi:hypothetical protein